MTKKGKTLVDKLNRLLKEKEILVADGAWGAELVKLGLSTGEIPEVWNLEQPSQVKKIAENYSQAGAGSGKP